MAEQPPPRPPPPRPPNTPLYVQQQQPQPVIVQSVPSASVISTLGGRVADTLATLPPYLLLIVLLNMAFAGVGGYYLLQVEAYRAQERAALAALLEKCLTQSVPTSYLQERMRQESGK